MLRRWLVVVMALSLVLGACAAEGADGDGSSEGEDVVDESTTDDGESASAADDSTWGSLDSPCGEGSATVAAADAGLGTDKLYVGVANERSADIRPGLLKELWDAGVSFSEWCNAQGGIAGLEIELVDMDGRVVEVEAAMAKGCAEAFAMVGGGFAQDNQMFSGKPESDFHLCGMIAIPGFAVSPEFSEGNGQVQPVPNPIYEKPSGWMVDLQRLYPDEMENLVFVWGNLPSIESNAKQNMAVAEQVDGIGILGDLSFDALTGTQDWSQVARQVIDSGAGAVNFVGEPGDVANFSEALKVADYEGIVFGDANFYDQLTLEAKGPEAVEGLIGRIVAHPYDESDEWPATQKLLDVADRYGPDDVKVANLSVQSTSAWLLFATSVTQCAADGEISRDCVLGAAKEVHEWDGGGLHSTVDPGANRPSECAMLMVVEDGEWTRLDPELGSEDDNGDGHTCHDLVQIDGDFGEGNIDPNRTV